MGLYLPPLRTRQSVSAYRALSHMRTSGPDHI